MTSTKNSVTSMSNKTVGYAEIEEATGVPAVTARRYAMTFKRWLPGKTVGRATRFPVATLDTFSQIRALFEAGKTTSEVREALAASVHSTYEVAVDEPGAPPAVAGAELPALLALGDRFVSALERIAAALESVAEKRPLGTSKDGGRSKVHGEGGKSILGPSGAPVLPKTRTEIAQEVIRLHKTGLGAAATASALRRSGWPTLSGRGNWGKGAVRRILNEAQKEKAQDAPGLSQEKKLKF